MEKTAYEQGREYARILYLEKQAAAYKQVLDKIKGVATGGPSSANNMVNKNINKAKNVIVDKTTAAGNAISDKYKGLNDTRKDVLKGVGAGAALGTAGGIGYAAGKPSEPKKLTDYL